METKPKYIQGYWRGKQEETKGKDGNGLAAATLIIGTLVLLAVLYWYITLGVIGVGLIGYKVKQMTAAPDPTSLVVNIGGKTKYI